MRKANFVFTVFAGIFTSLYFWMTRPAVFTVEEAVICGIIMAMLLTLVDLE